MTDTAATLRQASTALEATDPAGAALYRSIAQKMDRYDAIGHRTAVKLVAANVGQKAHDDETVDPEAIREDVAENDADTPENHHLEDDFADKVLQAIFGEVPPGGKREQAKQALEKAMERPSVDAEVALDVFENLAASVDADGDGDADTEAAGQKTRDSAADVGLKTAYATGEIDREAYCRRKLDQLRSGVGQKTGTETDSADGFAMGHRRQLKIEAWENELEDPRDGLGNPKGRRPPTSAVPWKNDRAGRTQSTEIDAATLAETVNELADDKPAFGGE